MLRRILPLCFAAAFAVSAQPLKYTGPVPPKPDVPYLKHADSLLSTDAGQATEEKKKNNEILYIIPGPAATARTPLASPLFLMESSKIIPEKLGLFKLEVKNGRRELVATPKKPLTPIRLEVTKLTGNLYKIEVDESLEPGEYSLSPDGTNDVFCFQVY
jgi:hypothetical protein